MSKMSSAEERREFDEALLRPLAWQSKNARRISRQQEMAQFQKTRALKRQG